MTPPVFLPTGSDLRGLIAKRHDVATLATPRAALAGAGAGLTFTL